MPRIFLDTEFTDFRDSELLSLGMVADDGRECYVEIADPARHQRASNFCKEIVLPQFGLVAGAAASDDAQAGKRVGAWLAGFDGPLTIAFDYKLDLHFLEHMLRVGGALQALVPRLQAEDIAGVARPGSPGAAALDAVFAASLWPTRHHALVDARALRAAWRAWD